MKNLVRAARRRFGLVVVIVSLLLVTSGVVVARAHAKGGSPLAGYALASPVQFTGRVEERLDAGAYSYLRVARDAASATWVVAVKPRANVGERVTVDALGHASSFDSKRLGRRFEDLWFAVVRKY